MAEVLGNPIPADHLSDQLFLLVGTNPLPNYVSALMLTRSDSTIYLLHSAATRHIANSLENLLQRQKPDLQIKPYEIDESDIYSLVRKLEKLAENFHEDSGSVGLNYTGGTKPMAVHAYRTLERYADEFENGRVMFSYLDARKLAMRFDHNGSLFPLNQHINITLEEMANLHGYFLPRNEQPGFAYPELIREITLLHSTAGGYQAWKSWLNTQPFSTLPDPEILPELAGIGKVMDALCGGGATPSNFAGLLEFNTLESAWTWLNSLWMEVLVYQTLKQLAPEFHTTAYHAGIKPEPLRHLKIKAARNFELDAAIVIGYQLYGISCIVSEYAKGETKKHLFEAFVRARQLGGDEARIGLVCCVENPQAVTSEIERDWHTSGQIRVFGRPDLPNLANAMRKWFAGANR